MKNVLLKLSKARESIKNTKMKKRGKNTFSKYEYFTPDQVSKLVDDACNENNLLSKFDLIRNELGIFGKLSIFDIDSEDVLIYEMASAIPEIKATNIAQQLGGAMTYTERYMKMSAFGIVDNSLDFDTTENTKKNKKSAQVDNKQGIQEMNNCTNIDALAKCWSKYKGLQNDAEFIAIKNAKKEQLK